MREYIERENLIDYLTRETGHKATCDGCCDIDCVDCIRDEVIKNLPTADVVKVCHGKWQEERWCDNFQHTCSLCHKTVRVHPQSVAYRYCPYCGAKMDLKELGK